MAWKRRRGLLGTPKRLDGASYPPKPPRPTVLKRTLATPGMPMLEAAAFDRSMILPFTNGPRSLIVTFTERPLLKFSTRTLVPNGNERCAAVKSSDSFAPRSQCATEGRTPRQPNQP
jgi:hypothetical protein